MTQRMVKGSNLPLDAHGVRAVLRWSPGPGAPDVDASMLLVGPDGRVRSDADFVFYNEPRHPSGLARHLPKKRVPDGLTDTVEVDLAKLDASVDRVVIAASCDGGPFRLVRDLGLSLYESTGPAHAAPLITFEVVPDTGEETALICGELYRKDAGWKFRALGQGYTSGLVGLATEFGIAVDDVDGMDGASGGSAAGPDNTGGVRPGGGAEAPDSGTASGRTAPHHPPFPAAPPPPAGPVPAAAYGYPLPPPQPGHVPAQPAYGYPQPVSAPVPPPVHQQPQQGWPAYGYPQPVAATVPAPVPQAEPAFVLPPQGPQFQPGR
ncbi:TerD family protein [Streptomyces sp. HPF1205]|uniref:TerD family protein n=1 Tax=Streptomyces sp. HPF1205 TaxID=2873262 RepID=UPI001CEDB465|nr:TerD family protein [Streptomyces sp. HPF1205]